MSTFQQLQKWYEQQCDGDWEHEFGIRIESMDNPGWWVRIALTRTDLEDKVFQEFEKHNSESDWIKCKVENKEFIGFGGAQNLDEIVAVFLRWADMTDSDNSNQFR